MEGSLRDLARVRLDRAKDMLEASKLSYDNNDMRTSLNRSYYAIFHAMRAVNCLDGFDSSKHAGVIANFNHKYVKEGVFDAKCSQIVKGASFLREKSDYDDFYIVSRTDTKRQLEEALEFV